MGQMGFLNVENRYAALNAKNDPLAKINAMVPWEAFRSRLEAVWRKPADQRKSDAGCKPWDAIVMFKAIVLCCQRRYQGRNMARVACGLTRGVQEGASSVVIERGFMGWEDRHGRLLS